VERAAALVAGLRRGRQTDTMLASAGGMSELRILASASTTVAYGRRMIGGPFDGEVPEERALVGLRHLLEHVGEPLVVESVDHLVLAFLGQLQQRSSSSSAAATSAGRIVSNTESSPSAPWRSESDSPVTALYASTCT
jgi:hypothetical protein